MTKYSKPSIFLLLLFILLNGNNPILRLFYFFPSSFSYIFWILVFILFNRKIIVKYSSKIFTSIFVIIVYFLFSLYMYDDQSVGRIIQFLSNITLAILVINYYRHTLLHNIEILLKLICKYSLVVWGIITFLKLFLNFDLFYSIPSFLLFPDNEVVGTNTHAVFFNFRGYDDVGHINFFRNPGFFWEPGALSGTVIMMYLTLFINKKTRKNFDNLFYLVFFTVLSTLSILGLATLFLIFLFKIFKRETNVRLAFYKSIIPSIVLVIIGNALFTGGTGIKEKIEFQSSKVIDEKTGWESNRLGTAIFILRVMESKSLDFGVGFFTSFNRVMNELRFLGYESEHAIGNGFFLLLLQFGLYFYLIILFFLFLQLKKYYKETFTTSFIFFMLILQFQGEVWTNYTFIYLFLFLHTIHNLKKLTVIKKNTLSN